MSVSPWRQVVDNREIPAAASGGFWTPVLDYVPAGTILKIQAQGAWKYADEEAALVGPAGDPESPIARDQLLNAKAPIGALVGKIGGSTGEKEGDHGFVVGSYCVLQVPDGKGGALMLAMNNLATARVGSSDPLRVSIYEYEIAPAPQREIVIAEAPPGSRSGPEIVREEYGRDDRRATPLSTPEEGSRGTDSPGKG